MTGIIEPMSRLGVADYAFNFVFVDLGHHIGDFLGRWFNSVGLDGAMNERNHRLHSLHIDGRRHGYEPALNKVRQ